MAHRVRGVDERSADELQDFINENDREGKEHNPSPIVLCQRNDVEDSVALRDVQDEEVSTNRQHAGSDQIRILPRGHAEKTSIFTQCIEGVQHFDHNQHGEGKS